MGPNIVPMNVSLTPKLEKLVSKKVASGMYSSASEVVREALRLLEERDRLSALRLKELKRQVHAGVEQLDSGRTAPLDADGLGAEARRRRAGQPPK